ncbi:ATP-dependent DNA helicase family protein [Striga asiatica]|uniref:DNA 3'-5' helicase n=1 Tax=Striga asiatica TaxID=4170 RepID=A0A5A7NYL1_STRAF|nr:ATP-dependent DNA helicase family protein [Striga asiatica]
MESDSDSDASHISATPPSSPSPSAADTSAVARRGILLPTTSRIRQTAVSTSTTSRTILQPKISRKHRSPPPKYDPSETEPSHSSQTASNFSIQINKSDVPRDRYRGATLVHGGHCTSKFASFAKVQGKNLNFEPDNSAEIKSGIYVEEGAGFGDEDEVDGKGIYAEEGAGFGDEDVDDGKELRVKKVRNNLNFIGANNSYMLPTKRAKTVYEGNFVKLNINGYGRKKFKYKNKRTSLSSSSRHPKYYRGSKGGLRGGEEEDGVTDGYDILEDIGKRQEKSSFQAELIEEAVKRVRNEASDDNLLKLLKLTHDYDSFRDGQLEAIKMVLSGKSAMLVLPTGAGKSLCYQLPALVLPGVTLVASPLVALMIDQLRHLPPAIPGGLLCSSQTAEEASRTLKLLQQGALKVLFVSPERFLNAEFISIFSDPTLLSIVVVDEAHCVSEWSHNFRPSYMRLRASLLHGRLNAGCILAMTATATNKTLRDVMQALEIPPTNLVQTTELRDNLHLSISVSGNRTKDLLALLRSSPFLDIKSIIIYCKFQAETEIISKYLCDNNISAKSYHSGIPANDRSRVQDLFCSNRIRVVVATVAFGMGLDKSDVGAVIHYSLPESLEEYVQEIGRAGRDGRLSYCQLLFDDATYIKLRSLMHSDGVDEYAVNKLLGQIFKSERLSAEGVYSMIKELACREFDMKEEVILTILTQLELGEVQYIHFLPQMKVTCTLNFHQTSPTSLAAKDTVVATILEKSEIKHGQYVFNILSVANGTGMHVLDLSNYLQSLKLKGEIAYELKDQAFCYTILEVPKDICSLAGQLTKWLGEVENCKVRKIDAMFHAANFAARVCDNAFGCHKHQHTPCMRRNIHEYFQGDSDVNVPIQMDQNSRFLQADIKVFLKSNARMKFTPRAVARILHGISSPAFPSTTWSQTHFWGRYVHVNFGAVMETAKQELMNFVTNAT